MAAGWEIQYYDEDDEIQVVLPAEFDQVSDEVGGELILTFYLPNINDFRNFVDNMSNTSVAAFFSGALVCYGRFLRAELSAKKILLTVYEEAMVRLDQAEPFTGVFDEVPANDILNEVTDDGDIVEVNECPTDLLTIIFYNANRLDCAQFLAEALAKELFSYGEDTISIGTKGNAEHDFDPDLRLSVSKRAIDFRKYANQVVIRGVDAQGYHIRGVAGSGTPCRTFNESNVSTETALNNIASKKLTELQNSSAGAPVSVPITQGYYFNAGDYINLNQPKYMLSGYFRMMQVVKKKTKVEIQLDKIRPDISKVAADLRRWEDKGIYLPGSGAWSLNLQGLVGLYRLDEGEGEVAKDNSPRDTPVDGSIVNGHWEYGGQLTKHMALQGDGYIDCENSISFASSDGFSVGCWFSPSSLDAAVRNLIHKDNQFGLKHVGTNGVLRFTFTDANGDVQTFDSNAGAVRVGARLFAMVTHDVATATLKMYLNGHLHKTFSQEGHVQASTNKVYLGISFEGVIAHSMLWTRSLSDQEVLELYFFPLNRVVLSRESE
jgi:hypothetical protein